MKTLHYLIIASLMLVFFFTPHMGNSHDAYAACVTINRTEECSTPLPILTSIQSYYVSGQTIHLVGISRSNSMVHVDLIDPNNNVKNSVLFQSESSGRFQNQLVVPVDAVNGTWKINISSGITHSTRYITVISSIHKETQTNDAWNLPIRNNDFVIQKSTYRSGDSMFIIGRADPNTSVKIILKDPMRNIIKSQDLLSDKNGIFLLSDFTIPKNAIPGVWNIEETDGTTSTVRPVTIVYMSPVKQLESGIRSSEIKCNQGLELIIKSKDNLPVCVMIYDAPKLVQRGWAKEIVAKPETSSLKLYFSTNPTSVLNGNAISIDISLSNISASPVTVEETNSFPLEGMSLGSCSFLPIGIEIFHGYYTEQNMTSAKSLVLFPPYPCPMGPIIKSYTFHPMSNQVDMECRSMLPCNAGTVKVEGHIEINGGYWNGFDHLSSFSPGVYTIVGGDEWGHLAIQHFTVTNSTK